MSEHEWESQREDPETEQRWIKAEEAEGVIDEMLDVIEGLRGDSNRAIRKLEDELGETQNARDHAGRKLENALAKLEKSEGRKDYEYEQVLKLQDALRRSVKLPDLFPEDPPIGSGLHCLIEAGLVVRVFKGGDAVFRPAWSWTAPVDGEGGGE